MKAASMANTSNRNQPQTNRMMIALAAIMLFAMPAAGEPPTGLELKRTLEQLEAGDWMMQAEAMQKLSEWKSGAAVKPLESILAGTADSWTRARAFKALAGILGKSILPRAHTLASDPSLHLRIAALEILEQLGTAESLPVLKQALGDADPRARYLAAAGYARIKGADAWPELETLLSSPPDSSLDLGARALARLPVPGAQKVLESLLSSRDTRRQGAVVDGISGASDKTVVKLLISRFSELPDESDIAARYRTTIAGALPATVAGAVSEIFGSGQTGLYTAAARALYLRPSIEGGEALAAAMQKDGFRTLAFQLAGMEALSRADCDPARHEKLFAALLAHENSKCRAKAIRSLSLCRNADAFSYLQKTVATETDAEVMRAALMTLGGADGRKNPAGGIIEYLKPVLDTKDADNFKLALDILKRRARAVDAEEVLALLDSRLDAEGDQRDIVIAALSEIGGREIAHRISEKLGYVSRWQLIGPFPGETYGGIADVFPPEREIAFDKKYTAEFPPGRADARPPREVWWQEWKIDRTDGKIVLNEIMPPPIDESAAYGAADINRPEETKVKISIEADNFAAAWLNGAEIARSDPEKTTEKDKGKKQAAHLECKAILRKGDNRLLVKACNTTGGWWFRVKITDETP